jgi:hypothetical protein
MKKKKNIIPTRDKVLISTTGRMMALLKPFQPNLQRNHLGQIPRIVTVLRQLRISAQHMLYLTPNVSSKPLIDRVRARVGSKPFIDRPRARVGSKPLIDRPRVKFEVEIINRPSLDFEQRTETLFKPLQPNIQRHHLGQILRIVTVLRQLQSSTHQMLYLTPHISCKPLIHRTWI